MIAAHTDCELQLLDALMERLGRHAVVRPARGALQQRAAARFLDAWRSHAGGQRRPGLYAENRSGESGLRMSQP